MDILTRAKVGFGAIVGTALLVVWGNTVSLMKFVGVLVLLGALLLTMCTSEAQAQTPDEGFIVHTVQPGEYIWCIARAYQIHPIWIQAANQLPVEAILDIGQQIRIPVWRAGTMDLPEGPTCIAQENASVSAPVPATNLAPPTTAISVTHGAMGEKEAALAAQAVAAQAIAESVGEAVLIRYSYYNPNLGGTNCLTFVGGECISTCANGDPWKDWWYTGVACPPEWAFGTTVTLNGKTWTCVDRGGAIKYIDGIPFVDFLRGEAEYPFKSIQTVYVKFYP